MIHLETGIQAVAVYPDRARVTRAGRLAMEAGQQTVVVEPLPRRLIEDSLRARGRGQARLLGVELTTQYSAEAQAGEARTLQETLERLQDEDRVLADEEEAWKQRLGVVKGIGVQGSQDLARAVARGRLSLAQVTELLDYLSQSQEAGASTLRELAQRRRELGREIEAAHQRAEQLQQGAAREWRQARIHVELDAPGEIQLELDYAVHGAGWQSTYDVRLQDSQLEWTYLARVSQDTGEDWLACELTLSTASLATGLDKPELVPWRVDVERPPQPHFRAMASGAPGQPFAMAAAPPPAPVPESMMRMVKEVAQVESSGPSVTYRIQSPQAIPSDDQPHQVIVAEQTFDATLDYFTAPKVDPHAFLRAAFRNTSAYVMLAGRASLYHGADFVGTRDIETVAPGERIELFLGADERIKVERKEIERTVDKNLLGNQARVQLGYHITVQNLLPHAARLTVLDQIPVAQHPDIKVRLREAVPKPSRQNEQGELAWEMELKPDEKAEVTFLVAVEHPKEMRIAGL